jgi:thioredoxin reductase (NADPH)
MYDLIIVGSGFAGYSAAIYAVRYNLKTLVIGKLPGGTITESHIVENYPGYRSISGTELMKKFEAHAKDLGAEVIVDEVVGIIKDQEVFKVETRDKKEYLAKAIILGLGTKKRKLEIIGQSEFEGKGVHYCATCDAPFYKNRTVAVVGGSNSAALSADILRQFAKKVYVIYRGNELRCEPIMLDHLKKAGNIEIITGTNLTEFKGKKFLEKVLIDKPHNNNSEIAVEGVFVEIGGIPSSAIAKGLGVELNDKGEIKTNGLGETNIPGVYSAGDVTNTVLRQGLVAASQGAVAATSAYRFLSGKAMGSGW